MELEVSLQCSQQPTTGPYPEPDESSQHPVAHLFQLCPSYTAIATGWAFHAAVQTRCGQQIRAIYFPVSSLKP
jgi:hypothetical protein